MWTAEEHVCPHCPQPFSTEYLTYLAALSTAVRFFQNARLVLGREPPALRLGHDFGIGNLFFEISCLLLLLVFFGRNRFLVRQFRSFLHPPLYTHSRNGAVSPILAQRAALTPTYSTPSARPPLRGLKEEDPGKGTPPMHATSPCGAPLNPRKGLPPRSRAVHISYVQEVRRWHPCEG